MINCYIVYIQSVTVAFWKSHSASREKINKFYPTKYLYCTFSFGDPQAAFIPLIILSICVICICLFYTQYYFNPAKMGVEHF